jgi:hypothetical protein
MESKKDPSRFVPTLTEVVQPTLATLNSAEGLKEDLVAELLRRLLPDLSNELQTSIRELLDAHKQALMPELESRIEEAVRTSLERASDEIGTLKP